MAKITELPYGQYFRSKETGRLYRVASLAEAREHKDSGFISMVKAHNGVVAQRMWVYDKNSYGYFLPTSTVQIVCNGEHTNA